MISEYQRVLFVHAHPDDETLATGALIAQLTADGVEVDLVTSSRGERGELVPGVLPAATTPEQLTRVRDAELAAAVRHLGIRRHAFLGTPPASRDGELRVYQDSGMVWLRPGLAGPAEDASEQAFSVQPLEPLVADLLAWIEATEPQVVLSYDATGGYGHPDHLRAREIAERAAAAAGLPFVEFFTWPGTEAAEGERPGGELAGVEWDDHTEQMPALLAAHDSHRTQFTRDGDRITHVGGQQTSLVTRVGLRRT